MRTAVVRVNVDPHGELDAPFLADRVTQLEPAAAAAGMELRALDLGQLPPSRRELQFLIVGDDAEAMLTAASQLCERFFGTTPARGVVTYISRGTDDDALGVLAGFGLTGEISRRVDDEGLDVVSVRLARADLERIPESRIQTALEASLNCEVHIVAV